MACGNTAWIPPAPTKVGAHEYPVNPTAAIAKIITPFFKSHSSLFSL